jgi:murein L,D-transpeptidase YcbB/YkuD
MNKYALALIATVGLFAASASQGFAQNAVNDLLKDPNRGAWDDQFDAQLTTSPVVETRTPVLAPQTIQNVEQAIAQYSQLVANGGWSHVPTNQKLEIGVNHPNVAKLRRRLMISGDLPRSAGMSSTFDSYVDAAVKRFQKRHGLPADGVMGKYSFKALNVPANIRLGQLQTNLGRLREYDAFNNHRYIMVNIPAASIEAVKDGRISQRHTAIVGRPTRPTPELQSKIYELNLNPYWNAPKSIIRKDIIPLMQKDPQYLTKNKIRMYNGNEEVFPEQVDWNTDEAVKYHFKQDPSKINAMGAVKINFPNKHSVYMHDTPQQGLFSKIVRFESSGCVRVQNVRDLIIWIANETPGWQRSSMEQVIASAERTDVKLAQPVPLYFVYISAWSTGNGVVHFRDDIYGKDGADELALGSY